MQAVKTKKQKLLHWFGVSLWWIGGHQINNNNENQTVIPIIIVTLIKTAQTRARRPATALPLLPTEVVVGAEDQEEAQDGPEDDYVTR